MTHTPGPWKFIQETIESDWAIVLDASGGIVANVNTETGPDATSAPETRKMPSGANAHLIAAAPDLLEACKAALDALEKFIGEWSGRDDTNAPAWVSQWKPLVDQLRAAIAKAEPIGEPK